MHSSCSPVSPVSWPALCRRVSFGRARCCFSSQTRQPDLPSNIEEMNSAAQSQFSPTRERETSMQRLEGEATHDHESR
ncbi:unnamed protein product [Cyprideis torosa]|uniref:Uncharacterized protein n=1 Tax=Cyprideis torosa TaxID=163714 RepID=A0A7R8ZQE1_9CRUS|nr:unnamed protein product [Cyprideis torosa]CAG0901160.1 unnamed protein product [Cyprideis torosa]